jgi:hypothetical protein
MLKKFEWAEGDVYSLKLRDDLYTLVQMRKNYLMQFFDLSHASDDWDEVDLNGCATLFFQFVAIKGLKRLFCRKIPLVEVTPSSAPVENRMLSMDLSEAPNYSAKLIELTDNFDALQAKTLTGRLNMNDDIDTIYRYELDGSEGNAERLAKRLIRYFDTGVNWDVSKEFLFKGILPPPPHYGKSS